MQVSSAKKVIIETLVALQMVFKQHYKPDSKYETSESILFFFKEKPKQTTKKPNNNNKKSNHQRTYLSFSLVEYL